MDVGKVKEMGTAGLEFIILANFLANVLQGSRVLYYGVPWDDRAKVGVFFSSSKSWFCRYGKPSFIRSLHKANCTWVKSAAITPIRNICKLYLKQKF